MVQQVVHGTRYIDEAVLEILEDGVVWVHQDANWNVLALTDFAGRPLERYDQTPYGIVTVDQESYFGDYDGDSLVTLAEVDSNTNGSLGAGDTCWGSNPSGACRVLDFDFDDDVDAADKTVFDALVSPDTYRRPGRTTSALGNTRAHQGLILDAEIGSFNNRARQYHPALKAFGQRDPLHVQRCMPPGWGGDRPAESQACYILHLVRERSGALGIPFPNALANLNCILGCEQTPSITCGDPSSLYQYAGASPNRWVDPFGRAIDPDGDWCCDHNVDKIDAWTLAHCASGMLGAWLPDPECKLTCALGVWYETWEPDHWPHWWDNPETPGNVAMDKFVVCLCCILFNW